MSKNKKSATGKLRLVETPESASDSPATLAAAAAMAANDFESDAAEPIEPQTVKETNTKIGRKKSKSDDTVTVIASEDDLAKVTRSTAQALAGISEEFEALAAPSDIEFNEGEEASGSNVSADGRSSGDASSDTDNDESDDGRRETADFSSMASALGKSGVSADFLEDTESEAGTAGVASPTDDSQAEFIDSFRLLSAIESLLFASDKPMSLAMLKQAFAGTTVDTKTLKKALEELQIMCADPTRGVTLEEVTGGWQFRTKLDNMDFLRKVSKARPFKLSGPALEVLSIIAYKQPLIKNEVDQIRGVESGHLVRALMEKGLVSFDGKTELPGKPMAYQTTKKFLEIFGLRNLHELPTLSEIDQLLPEGIGDEEEKETLSHVTSMMSQAVSSTYSEGEEELFEISEKIGAIDTSSEFFEQEKLRQKQKREREKAEDIREALAMGEVVDKRDARWLERFDAQLAMAAAALAVIESAAPLEDTGVTEGISAANESQDDSPRAEASDETPEDDFEEYNESENLPEV